MKNSPSFSAMDQSSLNHNDNYEVVNSLATQQTAVQVTSSPVSDNLAVPSSKSMTANSSKKNRWWQTWQFWGILLVLLSGGVGYTATTMLLRLPKTQSCNTVFWPVASASVRLYCAQTLAEDNTVESLLQAIALVEKLPSQHPLRNEINRNVEKWATGILNIGETKFQEGNLEAAIAIAQQIPENVEAHSLVESKIENWNQIWTEARENYAKVEDNLRKASWSDAFSWAVRLTDSKNDYWATTKYTETIDKINLAQEETMTLDKAANDLSGGDLNSLIDGINKAKDIPQDSYTYENAQKILNQGKEQLLATIDNLIEREQWSQLQRATYRIPATVLDLETEVQDWQVLANAGQSASINTVLGLEDAIAEGEKIEESSPLYNKAQQLIERWQLEIEDVRHLAKADELARPGNISAYNAAIVEASLIPTNNPRYQQAQQKITGWRNEIQIIEDRPIIERAKELAIPGNTTAWRRAIAEINLVSASSPLYQEAQNHARTWQANIEREEDQPILNEAIALGEAGEYQQAIAIAETISQGRALSAEAQRKISVWQEQINAQEYLQQALDLASQNTSDSLAQAIRVVRQIGSSTDVYYQVVPNVNEWSWQIIDIARTASYNSLESAIEIARKVPSGTAAYGEAESLIEQWQNQLNPAPLIQKQDKSNGEIRLEKEKKNN